jgi:hypothetical protein
MEPTLLVLAAGIGSRYGSLKQMDRLGPRGESIIDYSVYDAAGAGFKKVIFVLREEIVEDFYELFANRYQSRMEVGHVVQRLTDIPAGIETHPERAKPWGTAHAVLMAAPLLNEPFAVINGDDFYGRDAYATMAEFLRKLDPASESIQSMIGYKLSNTLSEHGSVARGICEVNDEQYLTGVVERTQIEKRDGRIVFIDESAGENLLTGNEAVSMNFWGFTPALLGSFRTLFEKFLQVYGKNLKSEFYIPFAINQLVESGAVRVKILGSAARWFGVTYQADKPAVIDKLRELHESGSYPPTIW